MLNNVVSGQPTEKTPILIAHGLFGSARNWGVIAKRLSADRQVVAVDMRNHGESAWSAAHGYHDLAGDLAEVIRHFGGKMDVVGHSMGGKAATVLALEHSDYVRRLVVADIAPTSYEHTQMPLVKAMQAVDLSGITTRSEANEALKPAVEDDGIRSFLLQSVDLKARKWRINLDVLASEMPKIMGFPQIDAQFDGPAFFLTGAASDYVKPEHRREIKRLFPAARFAKIPGANHWLHAEKPREFEAAVRAFLDA